MNTSQKGKKLLRKHQLLQSMNHLQIIVPNWLLISLLEFEFDVYKSNNCCSSFEKCKIA